MDTKLNPVVQKILIKLEKYQKQLETIQNECIHTEYKITGNHNDDNGWDKNVWITYWQTRHCQICDKRYIFEMGKNWSY